MGYIQGVRVSRVLYNTDKVLIKDTCLLRVYSHHEMHSDAGPQFCKTQVQPLVVRIDCSQSTFFAAHTFSTWSRPCPEAPL